MLKSLHGVALPAPVNALVWCAPMSTLTSGVVQVCATILMLPVKLVRCTVKVLSVTQSIWTVGKFDAWMTPGETGPILITLMSNCAVSMVQLQLTVRPPQLSEVVVQGNGLPAYQSAIPMPGTPV
ncbi:hypothetical protein WL93_28425 [Burkholderia diffusa]|nr:hypothetical protein WL93_28425 [Burkholderia diffusa]